MEEQKNEGLTPEQEEVKAYEDFIDRMGESGIFRMLVAAAGKVKAEALAEMVLRMDNNPISKEMQDEHRNTMRAYLAEMQVVSDMARLIIGDTAEEECKLIAAISEA